MLHLSLHFIIPAIAAALFFKKQFKTVYLIMITTMLVDADHLIATPIYDANRCSIGFHPLHHWIAIVLYGVMCLVPKTRFAGIGLIIHMALDGLDCMTIE